MNPVIKDSYACNIVMITIANGSNQKIIAVIFAIKLLLRVPQGKIYSQLLPYISRTMIVFVVELLL